MNKEDYTNARQALMDEVDAFLNDSKPEEANAKMAEVEALDQQWTDLCAAAANAEALKENAPVQDLNDLGETSDTKVTDEVLAENEVKTVEIENSNESEEVKMAFDIVKPEEAWKSDVYTNAWAKKMMGKALTAEEADVCKMVDEYTHTTVNTGEVIPETVAAGIWSEVEDMYPYYADIAKTYVNGLYTVIRSEEYTEAKWYTEDTETEDGEEHFTKVTLSGCELSRAIVISWKLKDMAISDFIPYITRRMAEAMGAALGYGVVQGQGPDATSGKPEPTGIITALEADGNQVVSGDLNYANITKARSLIKSGYATGLAVYASAKTIWEGLANVVDGNGRPLFVSDPTTDNGVFRILGMIVKEDASVPDGDVLISNAGRGYQANINQQISVVTEDHAKARTTDYVGYAIVDGTPLTYKAHALLKSGE